MNLDRNCVIPKNSVQKEPIYIVSGQPKTRIIAEENSQATLIERHIASEQMDITLEPGACITHIVLQRGTAESIQTTQRTIHQSKGSTYIHSTLLIGGKHNCAVTDIHLNGSFAKTELYALSLGSDTDQIEMQFTVNHLVPNCCSQVITRGVVNKQAKSAFVGKIVVQKDAIHTNASLENKNLLLAKTAEVKTTPQLEIDTDDIQCSHGATVGQLDTEALFYLQSRGIPEKLATQMLVDSFIYPSLRGLTPFFLEEIREILHEY